MPIPGFEVVNPTALPIRRVVVDVYPHEIDLAAAPANIELDFYARWVVVEKLRKAGVPVTPLTGRLQSGTLTWYDLCDSGARRFVWEGL